MLKNISKISMLAVACAAHLGVNANQDLNLTPVVAATMRAIQSASLEENPVPATGSGTSVGSSLPNFLYATNEDQPSIASGSNVIFVSPDKYSSGFAAISNTGVITIPSAGYYLVNYSASKTSGNQISGTSFIVTVNGSTIGSAVGTETYNGSWTGIAYFNKGDLVAVQNISGSAIANAYVVFSIYQIAQVTVSLQQQPI